MAISKSHLHQHREFALNQTPNLLTDWKRMSAADSSKKSKSVLRVLALGLFLTASSGGVFYLNQDLNQRIVSAKSSLREANAELRNIKSDHLGIAGADVVKNLPKEFDQKNKKGVELLKIAMAQLKGPMSLKSINLQTTGERLRLSCTVITSDLRVVRAYLDSIQHQFPGAQGLMTNVAQLDVEDSNALQVDCEITVSRGDAQHGK